MVEQEITLSKEEYVARATQEFVVNAGDSYEMVTSTVSDVQRFMQNGQIGTPVSDDSREIAQLASWSADVPYVLANTLITREDESSPFIPVSGYNSLRHYVEYLSKFADRKTYEKEVRAALRDNPHAFPFFAYLFTINPIVGGATAVLYDHSRRPNRDNPGDMYQSPYESWFRETIDKLANTFTNTNDFFSSLSGKVKDKDEVSQDFLRSWFNESILPLAEMANLATSTAIHVQLEDCAVLMTSMPLHGNYADRMRLQKEILQLWEPQEHSDGRKTIFELYQADLHTYNQNSPAKPLVPVILHVSDIVQYASFLDNFWQQVKNGQSSRKGARIDRQYDDMSVIRLGNAAEVLIRPVATSLAQARIAIEGTGILVGFNYRIDKDRSGNIGVDFGGITDELMLAYAQEVKQIDEDHPTMIEYKPIVDSNGKLKVHGRAVPSIMRSNAYHDDTYGVRRVLTNGNRAALVAAVAIQEGMGVGLRFNHAFTYHSYEYVNDKKFSDKFAHIADAIRDGMLK